MKILIIKLRSIGDCLLVSPLFENLKAHFRNCSIDFLIHHEAADIINTKHLNRIITLNKQIPPLKRIFHEMALLYFVKKQKYDLVFSLTNGERSAFLAYWSGAACRVGYPPSASWSKRCYTHHIPYSFTHNIQSNLNALRVLNIPIHSTKVYANLTPFALPKELIPKQFFHLHLFSARDFKCLDEKFCGYLISYLQKRYQMPCVLTHSNSQEERQKLQSILSYCKIPPPPLVLSHLTLGQVGYLNSQALAYIGVDTAIMHLSAANDIPTFAFFGPTFTKIWGPWDNELQESPYENKGGIQQMGKHTIYAQELSCMPCGKEGCENSQTSLCLSKWLNQAQATKALDAFIAPLLSKS